MKNNYRIEGNKVYIELNSRKYGRMETVIDVADFDKVNAYSGTWCVRFDPKMNGFYVRMSVNIDGKRTSVLLHRVVLGLTDPKIFADHINHDTLNNTKDNLRAVSGRENSHNRVINSNNKSGFKGVSWYEETGKWVAKIRHRGKVRYLGIFDTPQEAHAAYVHEKVKLHTHSTDYSLGRMCI